MKRIILAALFLLITLTGALAEIYQITATKISVRSASNATARIIGSMTKGMEIDVEYFENGFAKFNFNGKTGYVTSKYLKFLKHSPAKNEPEQPVVSGAKAVVESQQTQNTVSNPDVDSDSDGFVKSTSKKIGKEYNKFKEKLFGKKKDKKNGDRAVDDKKKNGVSTRNLAKVENTEKADKTKSSAKSAGTATANGGQRKFKTEKTKEYYRYAGITSQSEYTKLKGVNSVGYKDDIELAMKVTRYEKYSKFYMIFNLVGQVPKGDKILIRTGNGKVYEGLAIKAYKSDQKLVNEMKYLGFDSTNPANYYSTSSMQRTAFEAEYEVDPQCLRDLEQYGIVKLGTHFGRKDLRVIEFKDKNFEKASEKIGNVSHSMIEKVYGPSWNEIYRRLEICGATLTEAESKAYNKRKQEERAKRAEEDF